MQIAPAREQGAKILEVSDGERRAVGSAGQLEQRGPLLVLQPVLVSSVPDVL